MKSVKVIWNGKPLRDIYPHASWFQVIKYRVMIFLRKVLIGTAIVGFIGGIAYGSFKIGATTVSPKMVFADREVVKEVVKETGFPPILEKICKAESGGKQFEANGKVVRGKVNPSDIGYCQINEPYWNDKARELGFDIYTEEGNKGMALWILNNYGSEPWYLSKGGWKK